MNIREISDALKINRNSVAKYLDLLTSREEVEFKLFGKSKVYFLAQRVPVSTLMNFSSHLLLILNRDLHVVQINDAFLQYLDMPRKKVMGMAISDLQCDLFRENSVLLWCTESLLGTEISNEISIPVGSSHQYYRVVLTPTQFPDNTSGIILFFENITEKKQIKSALAESEENFRTLVEESGDGCVIIDETGSVSVWNKSMEQICGIPAPEALGNTIADVITRILVPERRSKEHIERMRTTISAAMTDGKGFPLGYMPDEMQILSIDGQRRHIHNLILPIRIGEKLHYGVIVRDITKRKQAEKALQQEKTLLSGLLDSIPDLVFFKDLNGVYLGCNPEFARFTGRDRLDIIGHTDFDLYPEKIAATYRENDRRMTESGQPRNDEEWIDYPDGRRILVDTLKSPLISTEGKLIGILGISRDITARKAAEDLLRRSEEKYRQIVETANEGIIAIDRDSRVTFVNQRYADFLGYTVEEIIGNKVESTMHPDDLADHEIRMQNRRALKKEFYERRVVKRDGSIAWILISVVPIQDREGAFAGSFAMMTDITERKQADQKVRESEARFEQVANISNEWIWEVDTDGLYQYSSAAVERILGYTPEEIVGRMHYYDLFDPAVREELTRETEEAFRNCKPFSQFINPNIHKDGHIVFLETTGTPFFNSQGTFTGYRGCDTDVTEQQNREIARLEAIEKMGKNIEHITILGDHIRNPLTIILGNSCLSPGESTELISAQVREIDRIIYQINQDRIESETARSDLRKKPDSS
jgi:PAS domain S-box-containing protein